MQRGNRKSYYADNIVLTSTSPQELRDAFSDLTKWAEINELQINKENVEIIFRKGGKAAKNECIHLEGNKLGQHHRTITWHHAADIDTSFSIYNSHSRNKRLRLLSLNTAMKLFALKMVPNLSYELALIWAHLIQRNLTMIEKLKAIYLKRVLQISKYTPCMRYVMAKENILPEDLRKNLLLPSTGSRNRAERLCALYIPLKSNITERT
jgi:hypothetical protein